MHGSRSACIDLGVNRSKGHVVMSCAAGVGVYVERAARVF